MSQKTLRKNIKIELEQCRRELNDKDVHTAVYHLMKATEDIDRLHTDTALIRILKLLGMDDMIITDKIN